MNITVIIATCGRPERLDAVLGCLREGKILYGHPVEVVVVDNHPNGTASTVVARWADSPLCMRYLLSRPRDKAAALNAGIRAANTEWLAFTDDDTLPDPDWLARGAQYSERSGLRVFGGRVVVGDDPPELPVWLRQGRSGLVPGIGVHVSYEPQSESGVLPKAMTAPFGANLFVRRDVFREHGDYDEALWTLCAGMWPVGCEDSEFGHRLHDHGEAIGYCREARVVHPVNLDRASIRLHIRRAYCEGWRQPLIFTGDYRRLFEPFRIRLLGRYLGAAIRLLIQGDPAGSVHCLIEGARLAGMITGRLSSAFRRRKRCLAMRVGG